MGASQDFVFVVPDAGAISTSSSKEADVSLRDVWRDGKKVSVSPDQLKAFWEEKVIHLTDTLAEAQEAKETKGFRVDEISFSLGVGASGGVFFVAQGSVQASMSVTLRRAT